VVDVEAAWEAMNKIKKGEGIAKRAGDR